METLEHSDREPESQRSYACFSRKCNTRKMIRGSTWAVWRGGVLRECASLPDSVKIQYVAESTIFFFWLIQPFGKKKNPLVTCYKKKKKKTPLVTKNWRYNYPCDGLFCFNMSLTLTIVGNKSMEKTLF
jgi:hypothetical protein